MGQEDIFKFLQEQRLSGEERFFSAREVSKKLREKGMSNGALHGVPGDLRRLEVTGFLEAKCQGKWNDWNRTYRLKREATHK